MTYITRMAAMAAMTVVLCAASDTASAEQHRTTFSGYVFGTDEGGLFGDAGAIFSGSEFSAAFTSIIDGNVFDNGSFYSSVYGGSFWGQPTRTTAVLTINGNSFSIVGSVFSLIEFNQNTGALNATISPDDLSTNHLTLVAFGAMEPGNHSYAQLINYAPGPQIGYGELAIPGNYLSFSVRDVQSGPVPEPATWALVIGGFGLAGTTLRRRRMVAT